MKTKKKDEIVELKKQLNMMRAIVIEMCHTIAPKITVKCDPSHCATDLSFFKPEKKKKEILFYDACFTAMNKSYKYVTLNSKDKKQIKEDLRAMESHSNRRLVF